MRSSRFFFYSIFLLGTAAAFAGMWHFLISQSEETQSYVSQLEKRVLESRCHIARLLSNQRSEQHTKSAPVKGWLPVQEAVEDGVVQVFTQVGHYEWLEPYKPLIEGSGSGSGFFINASGDIVTNYHVVSMAREIEIRLPAFGQERYKAHIIGACPDRDIALLGVHDDVREKIIAHFGSVPYLQLGDSDRVGRTQEVMALGFPLGNLSLKSTIGNVSGWQRVGSQSFIELTSPINPGNSGGPAVDKNGHVLGINSAVVVGAQNVGFFIPITEVKQALKDLYKVPFLRKPILGANFSFYSDQVRKYLGNPQGGGWYVRKVFRDTPLFHAGVQQGDVVYEIDGYELDQFGDVEVEWAPDNKVSVLDLLNRYTIGDRIPLTFYRTGARHKTYIEMGDGFVLPIRRLYPDFEDVEYELFAGMVIMPLSLNVLQAILDLDAGFAPYLSKYARPENQYEQSLIVTHVFSHSPAKDARVLGVGSLIDTVNGISVRTIEELRQALARTGSDPFVTITTQNDLTLSALPVKEILDKEPLLASVYGFGLSESYKALAEGR